MCALVVTLNTWKQTIANGIMKSTYLVCDLSPCVLKWLYSMNVNWVDSLCPPPKSLSLWAVSFNPYVCDCTAVTAGFMRSYDRAICTQMYQLLHLHTQTHTLDLIPLICQIDALDALKVEHKLMCNQRDVFYMVSMVTLWQWWSNSRMERNRQKKREVLWNLIVNGRGTLGLLKYDRPRQRRTFCNAMWLLLSVSNHWQVLRECFLMQFPYNVTWPIQHTPMSPMRGTIKKTGHMILCLKTILIYR